MTTQSNKELTLTKAFATFSDVPPEELWLHLLAQSLGINTLFTKPKDGKEISFYELISRMGGFSLSHPVVAKALMFSYVTKSIPKVYEAMVDNGLAEEKIYMFKDWKWEEADKDNNLFIYLKEHSHEFNLGEWSTLSDLVLSRCLTTNVRDIFYHFTRMEQYAIFLSRLFNVREIPINIIRELNSDS